MISVATTGSAWMACKLACTAVSAVAQWAKMMEITGDFRTAPGAHPVAQAGGVTWLRACQTKGRFIVNGAATNVTGNRHVCARLAHLLFQAPLVAAPSAEATTGIFIAQKVAGSAGCAIDADTRAMQQGFASSSRTQYRISNSIAA